MTASDYVDSTDPYTYPMSMTSLQEMATLVPLELVRQLIETAKISCRVKDRGGSKLREFPNAESEM